MHIRTLHYIKSFIICCQFSLQNGSFYLPCIVYFITDEGGESDQTPIIEGNGNSQVDENDEMKDPEEENEESNGDKNQPNGDTHHDEAFDNAQNPEDSDQQESQPIPEHENDSTDMHPENVYAVIHT